MTFNLIKILKWFGYGVASLIGLELTINWLNVFTFSNEIIVSNTLHHLVAELWLLITIIGGFLSALYKRSKKSAVVLEYILFIIASLALYVGICLWIETVPAAKSWALLMNGTLVSEPSMVVSKVVICLFGMLVLFALYVDAAHNGFTAVELPFLVGLLLWVFLSSLYCFNFFLLFLIMEAITLLVVVSNALYFVFTGPRLVKPLVQFFILNLMVSTVYLLGVALLLFVVPEQGAHTLSYATVWSAFETMLDAYTLWEGHSFDISALLGYLKFTMGLLLLPILFKLTLAPFSIWIVSVYSKLPTIFIMVFMTIYKVVYALLFIRLFLNMAAWMPGLQDFWRNSVFLLAVPSMFVGCLAYRSQDLKTILAYTTVSQLGYIVSGIIVPTAAAVQHALIYLLVYCLQISALFIVFLVLQAKYHFTNLNQLFLVKKYNRFYYHLLFVVFLSFAGIPPLGGFFIKYFLFLHIYDGGFYIPAICGLLSGFLMSIIYVQLTLQLTMAKESHVGIETFEHSKFNARYRMGIWYNRVVSGLFFFLVVVYIFTTFFFFVFPVVVQLIGSFTVDLVYSGAGCAFDSSNNLHDLDLYAHIYGQYCIPGTDCWLHIMSLLVEAAYPDGNVTAVQFAILEASRVSFCQDLADLINEIIRGAGGWDCYCCVDLPSWTQTMYELVMAAHPDCDLTAEQFRAIEVERFRLCGIHDSSSHVPNTVANPQDLDLYAHLYRQYCGPGTDCWLHIMSLLVEEAYPDGNVTAEQFAILEASRVSFCQDLAALINEIVRGVGGWDCYCCVDLPSWTQTMYELVMAAHPDCDLTAEQFKALEVERFRLCGIHDSSFHGLAIK